MLEELDDRPASVVKAELVRLRASLMDDMAEIERIMDEAQAELEPYDAAFWGCHRRLVRALRRAEDESVALLPYYDARVDAGHAAHPYRERVREVRRWQDAVMHELRAIDAKLTAADKAVAKVVRRAKDQASLF